MHTYACVNDSSYFFLRRLSDNCNSNVKEHSNISNTKKYHIKESFQVCITTAIVHVEVFSVNRKS